MYFKFYSAVRSVLWHHRTPPTESEGEKVVKEWEAKWRPDGLNAILPQLTDGQKLTAYMKQQIPRSFIEAPESEKLENLADKVGEIYEGCRIRGGYTEAAFEFLDSYARSDGRPESTYAILMAKP